MTFPTYNFLLNIFYHILPLTIMSCVFLPLTRAYPTDVPAECGGHLLTHVGLPCVTDMDCAPKGHCFLAPAIPICSCYTCERSPEGCCEEQKQDCAVTPKKMWKKCKTDADCVQGNTCQQQYVRVCTCPKPRPPQIPVA